MLDGRELDAARCVFAVEIDGCADGDVFAAYRHQAGELDVVDQPCGLCGRRAEVGVACCYPLVAFCEDEVR